MTKEERERIKREEEQARIVAELADLTASNSEGIEEIKKSLLSKAERYSDPDATTVHDLESRLDDHQKERSAEIALLTKSLDEVRLSIVGSQPANAVVSDRCIFGDIAQAKRAIHSWAGAVQSGEYRAIDTSVIASAGALPDEVADAFFQFTSDQAQILGRVQTIRMLNAVRQLDELRIATRKLKKTVENNALAVSNSATTAQRTLTAVGTGWTENISLEFLEENIEREGGLQTIAAAIGRQYSNDVADNGWNGDATTGGLDANVGWMGNFYADSEVVDSDLVGVTAEGMRGIFLKLQKLMPSRFLTLPGMAFTVPVGAAFHYADQVSDRETSLGDATLVGGLATLSWFGLPVHAEPFFNSAIVGFETSDAVVLTPNDNIVYGVMRDIETFLEFKPRTRTTELTIHARSDYNHINGQMVVNGFNLDSTLR